MKSEYALLFAVKITHSYYESTYYSGIEIRPEPETELIMLNNGLLIKYAGDGFMILFDSWHGGVKRSADDVRNTGLCLRFSMTLKDQYLFNYTAVSRMPIIVRGNRIPATGFPPGKISIERLTDDSNVGNTCFFFTNCYENPVSAEDGFALHAYPFVSGNDVFPKAEMSKKIFGEIEVEINKNIKNNYYIRLQSKRTRWHYLLASQHLSDISNPMVVDDSGKESFLFPVTINIRKKDILTISSKNSLSLSQYSKYRFKLVQDYDKETGKHKVIKPNLPVPDIQRISNASSGINDQGFDHSEIFL